MHDGLSVRSMPRRSTSQKLKGAAITGRVLEQGYDRDCNGVRIDPVATRYPGIVRDPEQTDFDGNTDNKRELGARIR